MVSKCLSVALVVAVLLALTPSRTTADTLTPGTLTYTVTPTGVQQTQNNPCIIGDPSCDTNTKQTFPLPYTSNSGPCNGGAGGVCNFTSPVYLASSSGLALPNSIPTLFNVGVDENLATGQGPEILDDFVLWHCDAGGINCNKSSEVNNLTHSFTLVDEHNGNGFTDGFIGQISLTAGDHYYFEAIWHNDTDGMEQFWIIPGTTVPVPEPGTLSLLGMGLLGIAAMSLRKLSA